MKKVIKPAVRRQLAKELVELKTASISKSCEVVSISECCYRYNPVNGTENEQIGDLFVSMINDPFKRRWALGYASTSFVMFWATSGTINGYIES